MSVVAHHHGGWHASQGVPHPCRHHEWAVEPGVACVLLIRGSVKVERLQCWVDECLHLELRAEALNAQLQGDGGGKVTACGRVYNISINVVLRYVEGIGGPA